MQPYPSRLNQVAADGRLHIRAPSLPINLAHNIPVDVVLNDAESLQGARQTKALHASDLQTVSCASVMLHESAHMVLKE